MEDNDDIPNIQIEQPKKGKTIKKSISSKINMEVARNSRKEVYAERKESQKILDKIKESHNLEELIEPKQIKEIKEKKVKIVEPSSEEEEEVVYVKKCKPKKKKKRIVYVSSSSSESEDEEQPQQRQVNKIFNNNNQKQQKTTYTYDW